MRRLGPILCSTLFCVACTQADEPEPVTSTIPADEQLACAPENGGIALPQGFCAIVVLESSSAARHLLVTPAGDLFVALPNLGRQDGDHGVGGVMALRDTDGDGRADLQERWSETGASDVVVHDGFIYTAPNDVVLRYRLPQGSLTPTSGPDTVVSGLPADRNHATKNIEIAADGTLFVNIGAPSNACQVDSRTAGSPGEDPCSQLETRGGIWRFRADRLGQTQADGARFATGLRNVVALRLHPGSGALFGVVHGRDQLSNLWPEHYTDAMSAELPAEEFVQISNGDDFGWPYCYFDTERDAKVLAPEYGGTGSEVGRCSEAKDPLMGFPAHWAPNDLIFAEGDQFPVQYREGAFIAFHGSWNRAPEPQGGYQVVFVPMRDGVPTGEWETFADGFAGEEVTPQSAEYRPVGLAFGPDGSLYISDSRQGRIWRVVYRGT